LGGGLHLGGATCRLADCEGKQRKQEPGQSDDEEGRAPAIVVCKLSPDDETEGTAGRDRRVEDGQGEPAAQRFVVVGDQGRGQRRIAGFANADQGAWHEYLPKAARQPGTGGGAAPQRHARSDQVFPREEVSKPAKSRRRDRVGDHEGRQHPAELHIAEMQLALDRLEDRRHNVAVDIVQKIDDGQYGQCAAPVGISHGQLG
jgi:hypothetical protein